MQIQKDNDQTIKEWYGKIDLFQKCIVFVFSSLHLYVFEVIFKIFFQLFL